MTGYRVHLAQPSAQVDGLIDVAPPYEDYPTAVDFELGSNTGGLALFSTTRGIKAEGLLAAYAPHAWLKIEPIPADEVAPIAFDYTVKKETRVVGVIVNGLEYGVSENVPLGGGIPVKAGDAITIVTGP